MNYPFNALGLSHKFMAEQIKPGDRCIDATAGRGRDTLFLAKLVGEKGEVIALDIQEAAVESTRQLLAENHIKNARVILSCHSKIDDFTTKESVGGIMFNFGWLPGGDHNKFSRADTSLVAIQKALTLLKPGGVMTLCLYYGKENGTEERDRILSFLESVDQSKYSVLQTHFINRVGCPPMAILIQKNA